jgi:hypothetical protein
VSFYIDIGQPDPDNLYLDTAIGGAITTALYWRSTARMDRAGAMEFAIPAGDAKADLVQPLYVARCYALLGGTWQQIAAGIIERIERKIDAAGNVLIVASGPDLLGELVPRIPLYSFSWINSGAGVTLTSALATLSFNAGSWTFTLSGTAPQETVYGEPVLDPILSTMVSLARRTYTHFYAVPGERTAIFTPDWTASGVRAVQAAGDLAAETCAITALTQIDDAGEVVSEIYPFGSGNAEARLTIAAKTRTVPAGYAVRSGGKGASIYSDAAENTYGAQLRVAVRQWKDISPLSSTTADMQTAANALFDEGLLWLQQHEQPQRFYQIDVAGAAAILRPLQTLRVVYRDLDQGIDIDEDLLILEATTEADADGVATVGLTVATVDRYPDSDVGEVVGRLAQAQLYATQPQFNANSYVLPYSKNVDQTETANFRFRFDTEVWQLTRCTFDFQLLPLESTVKTVGSSSPTSSASGDHSHTVSITGHTHDVTVPSHTHTVTIGSHTHDVTVAGHTHTVTIGSHTHSVPNHQHYIRIGGGSAPTYNVGFGAAGTAGGLVSNASGSDFNLPTNADSGGTTSGSGGSSTPTSSSGGGTTATSTSGGSSTPTSSSGGGTTATSTSGGSSTPTSASGGSHTHTVTPTITTTYGIYRDSAGNTFAVTDLEYSLDGSTWYNFSVGVNGYTTLGDGWTRVDLTALLQDSTTLRPTSANNLLRIRRKSTGATGKMATIDAQMNVRTIIQAVALT